MSDVYGAAAGLGELVKTKQPPGTAFQLLSLVQALQARLTAFEKQRVSWLEELGTGEEGQKSVALDSPNFAEFQKRFKEVMEETVDLPGVEPIPFEKFGSAEISAADLVALGVFLGVPAKASPKLAKAVKAVKAA